MNPARSLAHALLSGVLGNLWLYWSATFVGTSIVAFMIRGPACIPFLISGMAVGSRSRRSSGRNISIPSQVHLYYMVSRPWYRIPFLGPR